MQKFSVSYPQNVTVALKRAKSDLNPSPGPLHFTHLKLYKVSAHQWKQLHSTCCNCATNNIWVGGGGANSFGRNDELREWSIEPWCALWISGHFAGFGMLLPPLPLQHQFFSTEMLTKSTKSQLNLSWQPRTISVCMFETKPRTFAPQNL